MKENIFKLSAIRCRRSIFVASILLFILFTVSCKNILLSNGDVVTITKETSAFDSIYLYDNIDVTLIRSDCFKIELTICEKLIDDIAVDVTNSSLTIKNLNAIDGILEYKHPLNAKIYHKSDISKIYYRSVGTLKSDGYIINDSTSEFELIIDEGGGLIDLNANCKHLHLNFNGGSTDVNIKGQSITSYIRHDSFGPIHMDNFLSNYTEVLSIGNNDTFIHCNDNLTTYIYSSGNIYYKGSPTIKSFISPFANGKLVPINN